MADAPDGLQLDLLTVIQRLEQIRDEAEMRGEALPWLLTGRVFTCDIPRLRSHLTPATLAWEDAMAEKAHAAVEEAMVGDLENFTPSGILPTARYVQQKPLCEDCGKHPTCSSCMSGCSARSAPSRPRVTMAETPDRIVKFRGVLTEADLERFRQGFQRAMAADPRPVLLDRLPRRTRLRLWLTSRTDHGAIWLAGHGHARAAIALWRACGLWGHG